MNNNDVLRKIRYTFDYSDDQMIAIFKQAEVTVTREQVCNWLKSDDDEKFDSIYDKDLAIFLNGFINLKRGKREGPQVKPEKTLNNNLILRKLKIALALRDEDMVDLLQLADLKVSKHEINAFFRKPGQSQYRKCLDQFLRNFLYGLQLKYRKEDQERSNTKT